MRRKLQIFISSTFEDLRDERQAAVEAVLKAGHIPAGMELFTAGSQSQFEVIRRWIDESDVFMLILGARYGSIEPKSGLSYVESEFNYARDRGKPFFSVVLTDDGRENKVKTHGTSVIEQVNVLPYQTFKTVVTSHLCAFFSSPLEVKLAVLETLPQLDAKLEGVGWISAAEAKPSTAILDEMRALSDENRKLRAQVIASTKAAGSTETSYEDIYKALLHEKLKVPAKVTGNTDVETTLLHVALAFADDLARGVANSYGNSERDVWIMYNIASPLASWGLTEHARVPNNVSYQRLRLSKTGVAFLNRARVQLQKSKTPHAPPSPQTHGSTQPSTKSPTRKRKRKGTG